MKVVSIIGTRPEAIKMAPVIKALERYSSIIGRKVVLTGQHREMMAKLLPLFHIKPDYDLDVMRHNQTPNQVAAAVFSRLEKVLMREQPAWVLVQGDTTTTMAAAFTAFYAQIRIGHVEAGLRTHDKWNPFPEEINRRVVGMMADLHFAPTELGRQNLIREGVDPGKILVTGNTVVDACQWIAGQSPDARIPADVLPDDPDVRVVLLTAHRRENFGQGIYNICEAIRDICFRYNDAIRIVYPVHPNPNVLRSVRGLLGDLPQVKLLPPLEYQSLIQVMAHSYLVMTDSGGIQEEAPGLGKPVLVLRETTERPEAVTAGTARLVGTTSQKIVTAFVELWEDTSAYQRMTGVLNLYGDGKSGDRIAGALLGRRVDEYKGASSVT
jgi:UDP-N-acetylglucosamine 2-epimerase (non-hydrolysing)